MDNLELLKVYRFDNKIRLGNNFDGGYIIGEINSPYDCYISAGVSCEESFSRDFIKKYKMDKTKCFAFDGTIEKYPDGYTDDITFFKKNINIINDNNNTNLFFLFEKFDNIFVKMDIEGWEYPWILNMPEEYLKKIKQMTIEFHGIYDDSWDTLHKDKAKCWKKLVSTHYNIHVHGNNFGGVRNKIPETIEVTYINKNYFKTPPQVNVRKLPIVGLDLPNRQGIPDIDLNFEPFTNIDLGQLYFNKC